MLDPHYLPQGRNDRGATFSTEIAINQRSEYVKLFPKHKNIPGARVGKISLESGSISHGITETPSDDKCYIELGAEITVALLCFKLP